jgi:hypothetical protein
VCLCVWWWWGAVWESLSCEMGLLCLSFMPSTCTQCQLCSRRCLYPRVEGTRLWSRCLVSQGLHHYVAVCLLGPAGQGPKLKPAASSLCLKCTRFKGLLRRHEGPRVRADMFAWLFAVVACCVQCWVVDFVVIPRASKYRSVNSAGHSHPQHL